MNELIYKYFKEISKIPRETYHIEAISNYLVEFAKERNLEVYQDDSFNVIIKKEASSGYENHEPIILQGHMDMVCQKTKDSNHDFSKDGIRIIEEKGCGNLPVIIAKTQYSLSDNAELLGRPQGFRICVRDIVLKGGAGFIVAIAGKIMLMPGLGAHPAAEKIDLLSDGTIVGLS